MTQRVIESYSFFQWLLTKTDPWWIDLWTKWRGKNADASRRFCKRENKFGDLWALLIILNKRTTNKKSRELRPRKWVFIWARSISIVLLQAYNYHIAQWNKKVFNTLVTVEVCCLKIRIMLWGLFTTWPVNICKQATESLVGSYRKETKFHQTNIKKKY